MTAFPRHQGALDLLKQRSRYRSLMPRAGHDFASNDYLGLAGSDLLRQAAQEALARGVPVGAGGSRLLRGNDDEHSLLETEAAEVFGTERALFMGGGFQANTAIFATLPGHDDLILHDALIHASAHDGMRLGRAKTQAFAHNDPAAAEQAILDWQSTNTGRIWLAIETVYSMDGDKARVAEFMVLANKYDAVLVADEAHATGVYGANGLGLTHAFASNANLLTLHTCGKGLGVSGALICGHSALIDTLINKARGFIFATAPSPLNAAIVRVALRHLAESTDLQHRAHDTIAHAHTEAARLCGLTDPETQIIPVIIGKDAPTMECAAAMQSKGYDIRGIRPPTVPRNTSRLRISITGNVSKQVITKMFTDLAPLLEATS
ncbi:8-amino-7-oxononanoate synthase [Cognatishimia sp. 1_MG-2023]|uniref:8-amino-7-oxononanoate synthase n=1 Tax=Cognatishimia sp. 1_MG-2023 TaxID=3062642 RepID=UPI0026E24D1E|nr:8-amino-7-oxononanoate synthase [Cognatishimia sp. 1_MG-2023]MDO6727827.1 8-amino-7-oxononanoate synthase [Cognatishimia sp. 1_MG-2023]